jgi:16S rRNA C1402 (ribose-2'-O) methylase RsmI
VVKEISKPYQKVIRFQGSHMVQALVGLVERGEFVWMVHFPQDPRPAVPAPLKEAAEDILKTGGGNKALSKLLSEALGRPAKEIYAELSRPRD